MMQRSSLSQRKVFGALALTAVVLVSLLVTLELAPRWSSPRLADASAGNGDLSTTIQANGTTTSTVFLPSVMRGHPRSPTIFGVEMFKISASHGVNEARDANVYWVRRNGIKWHEVEATRGVRDWTVLSSFEDELELAHLKGLTPIVVVRGTPTWAQKVSGCYCGPIEQDALDEFADFMTALVNRYKGSPYHVKYWELGNEPDVDPSLVDPDQEFGCWGDKNDTYYGGRYYAEMLKVAYPAIKAADPQAQVLIGGLMLVRPSGGSDNHPRFLEGILEGGGGPYFDVVSFHAYTYYDGSLGQMENMNWPGSVTAVPEKVAFLQEVLGRYGYGDKALMNTEAALLCSEATDECLKTQAMYVPRAYAEALALGLEGQVYFAMINEGWRHTGLLLPDLTPKPVYYAYKTAATFLTSVNYEGEVTGYPLGVEGYTFHQNDNTGYVDVIWSADGATPSVTLPTGASAYDRYGDLIATSGIVQVSFSPVYVRMP